VVSTNIYLARHGETEYNRRNKIQGRGIDVALNRTGRQQAEAIAQHLKGLEMERIFSSSLKRSRETAEIVARTHELKVKSYADLDEMNFGILEGKPISEIELELQQLHQNWKSGELDYTFQNGESPRSVLKRAAGRIETLIERYPNTNLLFVLHGRLIRILLSHWLGYGLSAMDRVKHSNGALYHIRWDGRGFKSVYLNNTEHLVLTADNQH